MNKLLLLLCLAASAGLGAQNVVVLTLDTTRADSLSCYGQKGIRTHTLDRIASQAHRFAIAYSPVPQTLPAHCSLFTGLYPFQHGVRDNMLNALPAEYQTLAVLLKARGYRTAAVLAAAILDHRFGLARGFDSYDDAFELPKPARKAGEVTDRALQVLKSLKSPYFLWVHYYDPHHPFTPPKEIQSPTPYLGEVAYMDREIGRLLNALDLKSTLIVAVGDHGESLYEHKEMEHGLLLYEAAMRVPLLVHLPGQTTPEVHSEAVSIIRVLPTVLSALSLPAVPQAAGPSLLAKSDPGPLYLETLYPLFSFRWSPLKGVVEWPYKLILSASGPEVYDVAADPGEQHDLASAEPRRTERLRKSLERICPEPLLEIKQTKADNISPELKKQLQSLGYIEGDSTDFSTLGSSRLRNPADVADIPEFLVHTGPEWIREKKFRDFFGKVKEILKRDPYNYVIMNLVAQAYWASDNNERAHEVLLQAFQAAPKCHFIMGNLGRSYYNLKKYDESEKYLRQAIDLNLYYADGYVYLFDTLLAQDKTQAAEKVLQDATARGVDHQLLIYDRGLLLFQKGRCKEAIPLFEESLKAAPAFPNALGNLAYCLDLYGESEKAWGYVQRGLKAAPSDPKMYAAAYVIALDLGKREEARRFAAEYLKLSPDAPEGRRMRETFPDLP
jgi:arylsulfatase A-like enzyme/Flp pilus assembly protein TadD